MQRFARWNVKSWEKNQQNMNIYLNVPWISCLRKSLDWPDILCIKFHAVKLTDSRLHEPMIFENRKTFCLYFISFPAGFSVCFWSSSCELRTFGQVAACRLVVWGKNKEWWKTFCIILSILSNSPVPLVNQTNNLQPRQRSFCVLSIEHYPFIYMTQGVLSVRYLFYCKL